MCLSAHPDIVVTPETHYFSAFAKAELPAGQAATFLGNLLAHPTGVQLGVSRAHAARLVTEFEGQPHASHGDVLAALLRAYGEPRSAALVLEKTPAHYGHVDRILAHFPSAKLIHIVRDPRDVYLSMQPLPWGHKSLLGTLARFRRAAGLTDRPAITMGVNCFEVIYEDFVRKPEATLRELCRFLGYPFDARMLQHHSHAEPNFDAAQEPWKARAAEPVDKTHTELWRNGLTDAEKFAFDRFANTELKRYGYPPSDAALKPGTRAFTMLKYFADYQFARLNARLRRTMSQ